MRELAIKIKKEKTELNHFASVVRIKTVLDRLDLSEEKIGAFLEEINIHCFKQKISKREFISKIDEVTNLANNLNVPIYNIFAYINQKTKQLAELEKEIVVKQRQIKQKIEEYNITIEDLKDY